MNTERLGQSRLINLAALLGGKLMNSPLRHLLMPPRRTLEGAGIKPGQTVLEVGCGSGFFTLEAARMIGDEGLLIAMDPLSDFVANVADKAREAGLGNVEAIRRDALHTGLNDNSVDLALLFGVVPFPTLPLGKLLPEMHRVLRPEGVMAVWLFPTKAFVPGAIVRSGLFMPIGKKNGVYRYRPKA
ncbi:class I SAM-dependent methyltransferase [Hoeflea poritis]|uniref:Class I SAM-dependent methyltransferase n=1 Tax=Hoeflea poritis TaxID=2993659 RepID=A0ABT4VVS6_9HYPH|nr:class I SAM-dependent methyltransferase [Hoeflea poritis]MDA4848801.1 class I SAM-dependent methyltransferase [Hoeflea poritis]